MRAAEVAARAVRTPRATCRTCPPTSPTPTFLAERAEEIADAHDALALEMLGREEIVARGMGAFAAVAKGTDAEPRLIVLRYTGGTQGPHLGFVGKAVTFDTGGISLKPGGKMSEMKFDMSGGAAVLESMAAIAELGLPVTITAVVPATENMPSGHSVKPGDIVTAMNGKTIEINNTDAEGRLILADALAYAVEQGVERIVDLATLTGAIIVALGSHARGAVLQRRRLGAPRWTPPCAATGEIGWRLPLHPEYADLVKGKYADLDNAPEGRKASSITAAEFLKNFVAEVPWVHMDIAGTAWGLGRPYVGKGASGFGVRVADRAGPAGRRLDLRFAPRFGGSGAGRGRCSQAAALRRRSPTRTAGPWRAHESGLDDAIDTEETLRTSRVRGTPAAPRRFSAIVSDGSFEDATLDEFGLAALGELRLVVPSLVIADADDR